MKTYWKVGELARLAGLTIRTLRYYDQIGLLSPSQYSHAGHRLYTEPDLSKLQQILSLKYIGLSLDDIQSVLDGKYSVSDILSKQIERLKKDMELQQNLLMELNNTRALIQNKQSLSVEHLTRLLEVMKMNRETYFSKKQLDNANDYYEGIDGKTLKRGEQEFGLLMEKIRSHMKKGTPAADPAVQGLAEKWWTLVSSMTPQDDPEFVKAAELFHAENPGNNLQYGVDANLYQYINKSLGTC